jgi:phosphoribosylanthranilate isomerase
MRTRIKVCGLTREQDVAVAVAAGADAVGFNCYPASPRYVAPHRLRQLVRELGALTTPVLVFVNAAHDLVEAALDALPQAVLQFHGDEHEPACAIYHRPYLRAIRMVPGIDLLDCERQFHSATALLADAPSPGYGGSGQRFDWAVLPSVRNKPLVLAGGLDPTNVGHAIRTVRPYAVDVSSGVEDAPAIKSAARIERFFAAVRAADASLATESTLQPHS